MEAIAATADPILERPPVKLLREPLFWASAAAFVGVVVGLAATFSLAALMVVWRGPGVLEALWLLGVSRYILAVLSLLGVPALLGRGSRALRIGTALLLAWLPVEPRGAPLAQTLPLAMVPEGLALSRLDPRVGGHRLAGIRGGALIGFGGLLLGR